MRILVTGASGFVGRTLCPILAARGHALVAPTRATAGDLTTPADWREMLTGADAVVHLAAIAHRRGVDEERLRAVNRNLPVAIGRAAAQLGARMIHVSTVKVHGEETRGTPLDEQSPIAPADAYGRSKADAEAGLIEISGLALTVLRPPLVYGPGARANFFQLMRAVARGWPLPFASIENRRSLIYVGNLADAIARCVETQAAAGRTYLVSDGAAVSTPALCRAIAAALDTSARLFRCPPRWLEGVPGMHKLTRSLEVSDAAIRRELGWAPPYAFEEGLRRTAAWYRRRG